MTITHVAIRQGGKIFSLPSPNRHHNVIFKIAEETGLDRVDGEQGFLDDAGNFLDRKAALAHALGSGQVKDPGAIRAGILFSEDMW